MSESTPTSPALPDPAGSICSENGSEYVDAFTADQLRAYAAAQVAHERASHDRALAAALADAQMVNDRLRGAAELALSALRDTWPCAHASTDASEWPMLTCFECKAQVHVSDTKKATATYARHEAAIDALYEVLRTTPTPIT